jgi:hypothetical protein
MPARLVPLGGLHEPHHPVLVHVLDRPLPSPRVPARELADKAHVASHQLVAGGPCVVRVVALDAASQRLLLVGGQERHAGQIP